MNNKKNTFLIKTKNGLNSFELKLFALITMIIDHFGVAIVRKLPDFVDATSVTYAVYWILRLIGRCSFPIYCFFLVEGFLYTKSRYKYALRLFVFAILSEVPFDLALRGEVYDLKYQNVFFTLLIGLLVMCAIDYIKKADLSVLPAWLIKYPGIILVSAYFSYKSVYYLHQYINISLDDRILYIIMGLVWIVFLGGILNSISEKQSDNYALTSLVSLLFVAAGMLVADLCKTDYAAAGILTLVTMYYFRSDYYKRHLYGCCMLIAFTNPTEFVTFLTVPMILKYNGKRGPRVKYTFYAMYPLHLLVLYAIYQWVIL